MGNQEIADMLPAFWEERVASIAESRKMLLQGLGAGVFRGDENVVQDILGHQKYPIGGHVGANLPPGDRDIDPAEMGKRVLEPAVNIMHLSMTEMAPEHKVSEPRWCDGSGDDAWSDYDSVRFRVSTAPSGQIVIEAWAPQGEPW